MALVDELRKLRQKKLHYTESVWSVPNLSENIIDGGEINLFSLINDSTHKSDTTDKFDELFVINNGIKVKYRGYKILHLIRLHLNIGTGNVNFYRVELRRVSDNSVINTFNISRNSDEPSQTINIITRTLSKNDPFVVEGGGFYLAFANDSGQACTLQGTMQIVIENIYQRL